MIRRAGLHRHTPLRAVTQLARGGRLNPHRVRHTATGRPARRDDLTPARRFVLWTRSGGFCEGALDENCLIWVDLDEFEAAHRQARGQGGDNTALWNRWVACPICHRTGTTSQHNRPLAAEERGLWVRAGADPYSTPMLLPDGRRVLLDAAGGYREVPA